MKMRVKLSTTAQANAGTFSYEGSHDHPDMLTLRFPVSLDVVTHVDPLLGGGTSLWANPTTLPHVESTSLLPCNSQWSLRGTSASHSIATHRAPITQSKVSAGYGCVTKDQTGRLGA